MIRPLSSTGSNFGLRTVVFKASNSCVADRTTIKLSDGPRTFHSLDDEDACSFEIYKLSSDSESESSSSDDEVDSSDGSALIYITSATALGLGDFGRLSLESFFGAPPRGVPRGVPCGVPLGVVFGVAIRLLGFGFLLTGMKNHERICIGHQNCMILFPGIVYT